MSMLTRELAFWLQNRGYGVYTTSDPSARNIFTGEMPYDSPAEGLLILEVPSPPPHQYVDTEYTVIDFWYRSPKTDRGHAKLEEIYELFHRQYNLTLGNWYIYFSRALGSIQDVDRDREFGKLLRLSVQFICRNLTHVS